MADVELTELETIRKFSIATRGATAPVEEVIGALRADLDALTQHESHSAEPEVSQATQAPAPPPGKSASREALPQSAAKKNRVGGRSGGRRRSRVG
ncbi:MAG: hypothetical protein M3252_00905 [Actinomycetota bacterium]|nr:hypothetical protein [Actinomycetota bacterium]